MSDISCWIDGSCGTFCAGIGYEIQGTVEKTGYRIINEDITSMESELYALLEAVRIASQESELDDSSTTSITVYTDCRPLKRKVTASYDERDDWNQYRESAQWLLDKFDSYEVVHCSRTHTKEAHDLARLGLKEARSSREHKS
ncbi:MAG: RNase H [Candidatus Nanosalina sp. J07AB43]|nr:MAG: RNase H [Candidatus Nanosalina sp. J07AB43]